MSSMDKFTSMMKFGISLKLSGENEDKYYAQRLRYWIQEQEYFDAESENDVEIQVYVMTELALKVTIKNSTLRFEPIEDSSYEAIVMVLRFISEMHDKVQEDFKKDEKIEEEVIRKSSRVVDDEESDDDDDLEWI